MNFREVNGSPLLNHQKIDLLQKEIRSLKTVLKLSRIKQLRKGLRIYSKGLGVICAAEQGIKKNQLIGQYFGEVYPLWYWDLKQSVLNKFIESIKSGELPEFKKYQLDSLADFFNITAEKHANEAKGKEKFLVDPILFGNFTSRLSHSCNPNCWVIPVISEGKYSVAMFAIRDI